VVALLVASLVAGLVLQRVGTAERIRDRAWNAFFWLLLPVLVFLTFATLEIDRTLVLALVASVLATWILFAGAYAYARMVTKDRAEQGALMLAIGWPNTGFIGFPVAQLLYGPHGVALAVLYDRLSWLVPGTSASTAVARAFGRRGDEGARPRLMRAAVANPPVAAMGVAIAFRLTGVHLAGAVDARTAAAAIVGPAGFLLLGLSLPFDRVAHGPGELGRAVGALALRFVGGPLALLLVARAMRVDVPNVFYVLAAMPPAFHLMVLARVYDVRPALTRLLVIGSTIPTVVAVAAAAAIFR
jgi:predicted permease